MDNERRPYAGPKGPATVDQQIYLELKNINESIGALASVMAQIRDELNKILMKSK